MDQEELFSRLGIALAIGLLIGLERGWQQREEAEGERTAGLRTHALAGLLGGASAATALVSSYLFLAAAFLAFSAAFTWFSWTEARAAKDFSVTGVVAGILTFTLGAYAVLGDYIVAIASAVAMAALLALKAPLHNWVKRLTWLELRAVLMLLAMTFLLLPILPDRPIDPWDTLNPASIWKLTILIAGMSFVGYAAIRLTGDQAGMMLSGIAGGLASSTATTLSLSRMAREQPSAATLLAAGVLFAGMTMMIRIAVIIGIINPNLLTATIVPLGLAALVLAAAATFLVLRKGSKPQSGASRETSIDLKNPFDIVSALKLSALIVVIMVAAKVLHAYAGSAGLLVLAALSGLADVDALTLSVARLPAADVTMSDAADAILLCAAVNTIVKSIMSLVAGGRRIGVIVIVVSVITIAVLFAVRFIMA